MEMLEFNKEFVERTRNIVLSQCKDEFEYNVTLLINCLFGLISLPIEKTKQEEEDFMKGPVQKLKDMGVIIQGDLNNDSILLRSLRNALAHIHVDVENQNGNIRYVYFGDKKQGSNEFHTKMKFSIEQLQEFAIYLSDKHLEKYKG